MVHTAAFSPTSLIRETLSSRSDQALSALEARTAHSWMMAMDRAKVLPDANLYTAASAVRLFIKAGAGARVTDVDGTEFIDMCLGDGTQILGHAHPVVQQAIIAQSGRGWHFDLPADGQLELARLIQAAGAANERVALCSSSTEATEYAVRAARSFTGKPSIAVFTGCQHQRRSGDEAVSLLPYGHAAVFEQIRKRRHEFAAVIMEAVRGNDPNLDRATWLHGVTEACRAADVLLILDERQTGFRLAYGGAQEIFGLIPDLVIYGKAVGGGLPLGALAGRTDVMSAHSARLLETLPEGRAPFVSPLSVTAGTATLQHLLAARASLYPALNDAGRLLAERFNAFALSDRLPAEMRSAGSMFRISFGGATQAPEEAAAYRAAEAAFNVLMLNRGVLTLPGQRGFFSTAHTAADMECVFQALTASLRDVRDDGLFAQA